MKYLVKTLDEAYGELEKAQGYWRTHHGRMGYVKPYQGRPKTVVHPESPAARPEMDSTLRVACNRIFTQRNGGARKPDGWDEVKQMARHEAKYRIAASQVPEGLETIQVSTPMATVRPYPPQFFIAQTYHGRFFVDTQGYNYCRYSLKIDEGEVTKSLEKAKKKREYNAHQGKRLKAVKPYRERVPDALKNLDNKKDLVKQFGTNNKGAQPAPPIVDPKKMRRYRGEDAKDLCKNCGKSHAVNKCMMAKSVIAHTQSGKPIHDSADHPSHKDFSRQDHIDAYKAHLNATNKSGAKWSHHDKQIRLHQGYARNLKKDIGGPMERDTPPPKPPPAPKEPKPTYSGGPMERSGAVWDVPVDRTTFPKKAIISEPFDKSIIGHTRKGKAIHSHHAHLDHKKFDADDHADAQHLHQRIALNTYANDIVQATHHRDQGLLHYKSSRAISKSMVHGYYRKSKNKAVFVGDYNKLIKPKLVGREPPKVRKSKEWYAPECSQCGPLLGHETSRETAKEHIHLHKKATGHVAKIFKY
jgi:hypothetical protein